MRKTDDNRGITYIHIPAELLRLRITSAYELIILALAVSFGDGGLRMSNGDLADLLHTDRSSVQRTIARLVKEKGYLQSIKIKGRRVLKATGITVTPETGSKVTPPTGGIMSPDWCHSDAAVVSLPPIRSITKELNQLKESVGGNNGLSPREEVPVDLRFEQFWSTYPRQQGKGKARRVWEQLNPSPELAERIIKSVKRHKESEQWQKENGQFIPSPAKYLEEERWEDELEPQERSFGFTPRMPTEEELAIAGGRIEA